jgi:hypothetical protein
MSGSAKQPKKWLAWLACENVNVSGNNVGEIWQ